MFKKPHASLMGNKKSNDHQWRPMEDANFLERICRKHDASLFCFSSHNKKRPHNLILGRTYDGQVLDMLEFGVENMVELQNFKQGSVPMGTKPVLSFVGDAFDNNTALSRLRNLLLDFFRGPVVDNIRLQGVEHVIQIAAQPSETSSTGDSALGTKLFFRSYRVELKKSGSRVPRVELVEMGPRMDWIVRRVQLASDDLTKRARRQPKTITPKKKKNVTIDEFGSQMGKVHIIAQDLNELKAGRKKALHKRKGDAADEQPTAKRAAPSSTTET